LAWWNLFQETNIYLHLSQLSCSLWSEIQSDSASIEPPLIPNNLPETDPSLYPSQSRGKLIIISQAKTSSLAGKPEHTYRPLTEHPVSYLVIV